MSGSTGSQRRVRVERNIYRRATGVFEVGFKDGAGIQRWRTVDGGIMAARAMRDDLLARRGRGEVVVRDSRLRFGDAAEQWLNGPVLDLRQSTQAGYRNAVEQHLRPRYANRRLDSITADDLATLVREMRQNGKSEATILVVLGVTGRIYKFATRRLGWAGTSPTTLMLLSERPKVSLAKRRPIFTGEQIEQTIAAARQPHRTMFTVAALTGARMSELCGLTWRNIDITDTDEAELTFGWQVDRKGNRRPTKTDGSARTVPIPRELAVLLARHKLAARDTSPDAFVFATRTGRPLGQRNVQRALRQAERDATDADGRPTFPILHAVDAQHADAGAARRTALNALVPSYGRVACTGRRREHRRGGLPPWSSRRDRHSDGIRSRDRRRQAPRHAPFADGRRVRRRPASRAGRRPPVAGQRTRAVKRISSRSCVGVGGASGSSQRGG